MSEAQAEANNRKRQQPDIVETNEFSEDSGAEQRIATRMQHEQQRRLLVSHILS